jgi:Flp pilus assembly protein TadG
VFAIRNNPLKSMVRSTPSARQAVVRRGAAAIEAAITLPMLIILVFGSIEMANAIFLRQSLNMAAYEAAKVVTRPGDNTTLAEARCANVMAMRKVTTYSMTITPAVTASTPEGTQVSVTVSAPASNLSYGPVRFMSGKTVVCTVTMVRL